LYEDNEVVAEAFEYLINETGRYNIVGRFDLAEDAISYLEKHDADLVLMDINLPGIDGITATAKIKDKYPEIDILIISVSSESQHVF
jgi:DNA-binding NarL/FixJ family response regulator